MTVKSTTSLGPYNRYVIWAQGCLKRCPGCISKDSQPLEGGYERSITELADEIIDTPGIEGITISGGEPFLQAEGFADLIEKVRLIRDIGVIVYTGFTFGEISQTKLAEVCDMVIDGTYIEELNDGLSLRGSSNQKIYLITERYKEEAKTLYGTDGRKVEVRINGNNAMLIGIPDKDSLQIFKIRRI